MKNTLNVTRFIQRSLMYILLELLEYQLAYFQPFS